ncbi:MAG TPA: PAS domain S-box protein [Bryobacteraceae bacterium]|nr:PAS domain S-box protein [Bryobacteraceae bacterium]
MSQAVHDPSVEELRERVSELEAENAMLRQLDEAFRRNSRLFEALLARSQDAILLVTPQLTFLKVVHSVLGNTDRELTGQPVLSVLHSDDGARVTESFGRLLSGQHKSVICECRAMGSDGAWHWVEVEMTDLLDDPDVQAIVFNGRRIGNRKE